MFQQGIFSHFSSGCIVPAGSIFSLQFRLQCSSREYFPMVFRSQCSGKNFPCECDCTGYNVIFPWDFRCSVLALAAGNFPVD